MINNISAEFNQKTFHLFVTSVLRRIAIDENCDIQFDTFERNSTINENNYEYNNFDAIAYKGILGITGVVIFEIRYSTKSIELLKTAQNLRSIAYKLFQKDAVSIVLVTNQAYENKEFYENKNESSQIKTIIFDKSDVQKWVIEYPIDYNNTIINYNKKTINVLSEYEQKITNNDFEKKRKSNEIELKRIMDSDNSFSIVLGAGISVDPGAKSWKDLLIYFEEELMRKHIICDRDKLGAKIGGSALFTAQLCKDLYLSASDFYWAIHQGLYNNRKPICPDYVIYHISKIIQKNENKKRIKILTYNFDEYLENYLDELRVQYNSLYDCECMMSDKIPIYHIHGYLPRVEYKSHIPKRNMESIYLTEENYNTLYNSPYSWQISSQLSCFRESTCLFIGCSLADHNIRRLLEMTAKEHRHHFAILTKDKMTTVDLLRATNHFSRIGVEIIWVEDFTSISAQLKKLYL